MTLLQNLTISFTSFGSLWVKPCYQNILIYDSDDNYRFSSTTEKILAFISNPNMVREVNNLSPNSKKNV